MKSLETFISIFKTGTVEKITIPKIQRDYAQGRDDTDVKRVRKEFLDYLYDAITKTPKTLDFIYGTIKDGELTPLDGQQRLTTLFLLHWYAAKKENIEASDWEFLSNFCYEIRESSTKFIEQLIKEDNLDFNRTLSKEIRDKSWFRSTWELDPTVKNMITMLDAIQDKFEDVENIWANLEDGAITFYLLSDKELLQSDELYIRMNSRGKPLTRFEHFKAQLSKNLKEIDKDLEKRILDKVDGEWTDILWKYKDENNLIDNQFLNMFKFICDVIRIENNMKNTENYDEFFLLEKYFPDNMNALENLDTLEKYFDSIASLGKELPNAEHPTEEFLSRFISQNPEEGKIVTDRIDNTKKLDLISHCFFSYMKNSKTRQFTYPEIVLLYAIMQYLTNRDHIKEEDFDRRLRIINNLVKNSEDELTEREKSNRLSDIFKQTEHIMKTGEVDDSLDVNFNSHQLEEEKKKIEWLKENQDKKDLLYKLENHPRLYGQISIIGVDDIDLTDKFIELFKCDKDLISCALMTKDFYGQETKKVNAYQLGNYFQLGSKLDSSWNKLLHKSNNNQNYEKTSNILKSFLRNENKIDEKVLSEIVKNYITTCEKESVFPLNYYYVKYKHFRPDSFGKYYIISPGSSLYQIIALKSESKLSPFSYSPFLYEIDEHRVPAKDNGQRLIFDNVYIQNFEDSFIIFRESDDSEFDKIKINQTEGIDTEDRIVKLRNYLIDHGYMKN